MRKLGLTCSISIALASAAAWAETTPQKKLDDITGCVDRARAEKYIADHNFAELLRGTAADGATHAVWTNGRQALSIHYARPPEDKMDRLQTICVDSVASDVTFNLYVIEKLVSSGASATDKK